MSNSLHTPGPWHLRINRKARIPLSVGAVTKQYGHVTIARLFYHSDEPGEVIRANARLIVTAPELLALARHLVRGHVQELTGGVCDCPHCEEALALIAK